MGMSHSTIHFPEQTNQDTILKFNNPYRPDPYSFSPYGHFASLPGEGAEGFNAQNTGIRTTFNRKISIVRNRLTTFPIQLMDINCFIFLIVISTILLFFHRSVTDWKIHYLTHILYILFILFNIAVIRRQKHNRFLMASRLLYPVSIILFAWNELTYLIPMIYGNYWATDWIMAADKFLFGVHPTLWFQQWYRPWLDELMNLCYSSYYFYMPLILLALFYKKRYNDLSQVLSIATWTFLGKFIFYYLLPVLGPRMVPELQSSFREYSGFFIDHITRMFQSGSGIVGGAFPSSHVGGGVMWTLVSLKYFKKAGLFMIPLTLGMTVATVYLGYHHALDSIAGLAWGIASFILVSNWNRRLRKRGDRRLKMKDER
jgi:membrane-associated phospholipid phosphatase